MFWVDFSSYALICSLFWIVGLLFLLFSYKKRYWEALSYASLMLGWIVLLVFVVQLWTTLGRPPMRTLGETRLWYTIFLPFIGFVIYFRWRFKWFLAYAILMALVFLGINYTHPETYSQTLMPALRSPWFIPHVLVYLFSYALLTASGVVAIRGLFWNKSTVKANESVLLADNLVYIGFGFLSMGMLFGALWAKEAWGHYWAWDPKEIWAAITWVCYLLYVHYRFFHPHKNRQALYILALALMILLISWFGVNYLPVAKTSVHTYTQY